jgi:hypothetical protein
MIGLSEDEAQDFHLTGVLDEDAGYGDKSKATISMPLSKNPATLGKLFQSETG